MTYITYPPDLRNSIKNTPYLKLASFRYRERNFVIDDKGSVGSIDPEKRNLVNYYLPLPENIENQHNINWEMADLKAIKGLEDIFKSGSVGRGIADNLENIGAIVGPGLARLKGNTANPKKQALFSGIDPRTFSFTFNFAPQSLKEARALESLIKELTMSSLPDLVDDASNDDEFAAFFNFPDEFEIAFVNVEGFPKIYNTVCTSVSTNYTPQALQLLSSGHSVNVSLSINFLETELLRKTKPGI